jgi:hypothetical protein
MNVTQYDIKPEYGDDAFNYFPEARKYVCIDFKNDCDEELQGAFYTEDLETLIESLLDILKELKEV